MPGRVLSKEDLEKMAEGRRRSQERKRQQKEGAASAQPKRAGLVKRADVNRAMLACVAMADVGLAYAAPQLWVTPEDRLTEKEMALLAAALSDEVVKHPLAMRLLERIYDAGQKAGIIGAVIIIALPRLHRRGLIPNFLIPVIQATVDEETLRRAAQEVAQAANEPEIPRAEETPQREAA